MDTVCPILLFSCCSSLLSLGKSFARVKGKGVEKKREMTWAAMSSIPSSLKKRPAQLSKGRFHDPPCLPLPPLLFPLSLLTRVPE